MRKPLGLFVAAFATVAGGGLAVAVEGTSTSETESTESTETTETTETTATTDTTLGDPEASTVTVEEELEVEGDGGEHGARVSQAAHDCHAMVEAGEVNPDTGEPYRNHGECVSRVARDHDGDGTPDTPRGDDEDDAGDLEADDADDDDGGPGRGHGRGRGRGHAGD